jgi:hypothetical protein
LLVNAVELAAAIHRADALDEVWSFVVAHKQAPSEIHSCDGASLGATVTGAVREALLSLDPVPCNVARRAGIDLLIACERCDA